MLIPIETILKRIAKMPLVTVTKADTSKGGAPRVYFDNKHDWKDAYYVGKKIEAPAVGLTIEANTSSRDYQGKTYWYLNSWNAPNPPKNFTAASPPKPKGWDIDYGDLSRLVSNIIGSAIEAKLINDPDEIGIWVAAAYRAGETLRSGKIQDFHDRIDFGDKPSLDAPIDDNEPSF
jgi:hypothetical protein